MAAWRFMSMAMKLTCMIWIEDNMAKRKNGLHIDSDGNKEWFLNGKRHREDGPAIEHRYGMKVWCINDKCHREDGPAIEYTSGRNKWYLNDNFLGYDVVGFWAHWALLTPEQRNNLNLHFWMVKYT